MNRLSPTVCQFLMVFLVTASASRIRQPHTCFHVSGRRPRVSTKPSRSDMGVFGGACHHDHSAPGSLLMHSQRMQV